MMMAKLSTLVVGFSLLSIGVNFVKPEVVASASPCDDEYGCGNTANLYPADKTLDGQVCTSEECQRVSKEYQLYMNQSVDPCDDFYEYACGNFHHYYPPDQSMFSLHQKALSNEIAKALDDTAEYESNSTAVQYLTKLYHQCNQSDAGGLESLKAAIKELHDVKGGWMELITKSIGYFGLKAYLQVDLVPYPANSRLIRISTAEGGASSVIFLYQHYAKWLKPYRQYIRNAAILLGAPNATSTDEVVDRIIELETKFAEARRSIQYLKKLYTLDELNQYSKNHTNWMVFLGSVAQEVKARKQSFAGTDRVQLIDDELVLRTVEVFSGANQSDLATLFSWLVAQQYGPLVSSEFRALENEYRRAIDEDKPVLNNHFCFDLFKSKLGYALERVYTDKYFEGGVHRQSARMIAELRTSLKSILEETTWLDNSTKAYAVEKLEAMTSHLGAPKWILDSAQLDAYYDFVKSLDIVPNQLLESVLNLQQVFIREVFDFNGTQPRKESYIWEMVPPFTVNAANFLTYNQIVIPTAIIRPPFFDQSWPYMMNYGHLGAIIGHELTHGFDNHGSRYDKQGKVHNWWSKNTLTEFTKRSQCFVEQYSEIYDPRANMKLHGEKTLGEDIADNGGVKEAFGAMQSHAKSDGHPGPVLPGLKANPEQLYFLSWAWNFCDTYTPSKLHAQIQSDVHSPSRYRILVPLRNSPHFAKAFNCPLGSAMNPVHKCAVW